MTRWMAASLILALMMSVGCTHRRSLIELREDGQYALDHEKYDQAQMDFQEVLNAKPEDPVANYGLGKAYLALGDAMRARTHLAIAYQQWTYDREKTFEIGQYLAEAMAQSGDKQGMIQFLRDAAQSGGQVRDYLLWGDMAAKYGDPDSAELAYRTAIRVEPAPTVLPYWKLALFYESIGKTEAATQRLRQAYWIEPGNEQVVAKLETYYNVVGPSLKLAPDR